jgi:hypothetical protein
MSVATIENGFIPNRHLKQYIIECDIDSSKICDIMSIMMVNYCKVDVCGYNTLDDKYWGKKINGGVCELYFQITVKNLGYNNTNVIITPTFGLQKIVDNLFKTVNAVVRLCEMLD